MKYDFPVTLTTNPKQKPESKGLRFGTVMTDHMILKILLSANMELPLSVWR